MSRRLRPVLPVALLLVAIAAPAVAEEADEPKVHAKLVADAQQPAPGSTFRLGVHFEIEDGWHIYWRYPGGAGLATAIDFTLPAGLNAGPLQWPLPIAFTQSEAIPGYGYEDSVVLAAEVAVASGFEAAATAPVRAEVSWLACKKVCVLGSSKLEGPLAKLQADPVFREWSRGQPKAYDEGDAPYSLSTTGGLAAGVVTHWLRWRETARPVEFFPDPSEALDVGDVRIQTRGGLTRIDVSVRQRKGSTGSIDELASLIVVTESDGRRRGWEHSVDLNNSEG